MFVRLELKDGGEVFVRPEMVKAIQEEKDGNSFVVIDGHQYLVKGTPMDVMHATEFDVHCVHDCHPEPGHDGD